MNSKTKGAPAAPSRWLPGDPIPLAEAVEADSDTAWQQFQDLSARHEAQFARTAPAEFTHRAPAPAPASAPRGPQPPTLDQVLALARRHNRVCPKPAQWQALYMSLPPRQPALAPPLTGPAWNATPSLAKRMALRDHLEWAERSGRLAAVQQFLERLAEDDWHHMGD